MKKNNTLKELLIGIFIVGILAQIVCLIFWDRRLYNAIGLWAGVLVAAGMSIHMHRSIEDGLDLMGESGIKYMRRAYMVRILLVCVVIAIILYFNLGNPLMLLVGIMALKIAAYLQPLVHKVLEKQKKGE